MKKALLLTLSITFAFAACAGGNKQAAAGGSDYVFVAMDAADEHFIKANEGVQAKAKELGVSVQFQAPASKANLDEQSRIVEDAVVRKAKGIILAALDPNALAPAVEKAAAANIPIVYLDSGTSSDKYIAYAATDNEIAAAAAGEKLAQLIGQSGKIAIIHPVAGIATIEARKKGFNAAIAKYPGIKVVAELHGNGGDAAIAMNQANDVLTKNPDLIGFFASNTEANEGVLRALEERMRTNPNAKKVFFIGFDFSQNIAKGVQNKVVDATVIQNPRRMGELSIQALVDYANGKKTEPRKVDTGYILVTPENVAEHIDASKIQS